MSNGTFFLNKLNFSYDQEVTFIVCMSLRSPLKTAARFPTNRSSSDIDLRLFHGHIIKVAMNGSNGGFARYTLTIEPWTAFLAHGSDSRIFQDMTVFAIFEAVFDALQGQGTLTPVWRLDIADESVYPRRSLTTQYHESDLALIERLLHEEGLFYFRAHWRRGRCHVGQQYDGDRRPQRCVRAEHLGIGQFYAAGRGDEVRFNQPLAQPDALGAGACSLLATLSYVKTCLGEIVLVFP